MPCYGNWKKLILILVLVAVKYNDKTHISQKQIRIETVVAFHCSHSIANWFNLLDEHFKLIKLIEIFFCIKCCFFLLKNSLQRLWIVPFWNYFSSFASFSFCFLEKATKLIYVYARMCVCKRDCVCYRDGKKHDEKALLSIVI